MKHSKKIVLVLLALFSLSIANGQQYSFNISKKGTGFGYSSNNAVIDKGLTEGTYFIVQPEISMAGFIYSIQIREVKPDFKEIRHLTIKISQGALDDYVTRDGSMMHIVISSSDNKQFSLRHVSVNLATFEIEKDTTILSVEIAKSLKEYHWIEFSSSRDYFGVVYALHNSKANTAKVIAVMYNKDIEYQWTQELNANLISQIFVTDDGQIVTGGYSNGSNKDDGAILEFNVANKFNASQGQINSDISIGELSLLNYYGDKVLALALNSNSKGTAERFISFFKGTSNDYYYGCTSYLYNIAMNTVVNSSSYKFTAEDARVFNNDRKPSKKENPKIDCLSSIGSVTTPDGGAVLYHRNWIETVTNGSTGQSSSYLRNKGMLLVYVDKNGSISWTRGIPHDNYRSIISTETYMITHESNIYVLTNESPKAGNVYNENGQARRPNHAGYGALSIYAFTPDGTVSKEILAPKGKNFIRTKPMRFGDGIYRFYTGLMRGHITELGILR